MNTKIVRMLGIGLISAVMAVSSTVAYGGSQDWQKIPANGFWDYLDRDIARLQLGGVIDGMQRVGDSLIAVMYVQGCGDCGLRDVIVLKNGEMKTIEGVPLSALESREVLVNGNRIIWVEQSDRSGRFNVYEANLTTGERVRHHKEIFLGNASHVDVRADGMRFVYAIHGVKKLGNDLSPVSVKTSISGNQNTQIVNQIWRNSFEEIMDIREDGRVLTRVIFENGDAELWYHGAGESRAIPDSYTIDGYLLAAQFVGNNVEFFRYQTLMKYDPDTWATTTVGETLLWREQILEQEELYLAHDGVLFYVTFEEEDSLHYVMRRKNGVTAKLGTWNGGMLDVLGDDVQYNRNDEFASGIDRYDAATGQHVAHIGGVEQIDVSGAATVGVDRQGIVAWTLGDNVVELGRGRDAYLADETHVYWTAGDSRLRTATIKPRAWLLDSEPLFAKSVNSPTVYLLKNGVRSAVVNEPIYYSWRSTFDGLVDLATINESDYIENGIAPYAPGTLLRMAGSSAVYVTLDDTRMQVIPDEDTAFAWYGYQWDQNVRWSSEFLLDRYELVEGVL